MYLGVTGFLGLVLVTPELGVTVSLVLVVASLAGLGTTSVLAVPNSIRFLLSTTEPDLLDSGSSFGPTWIT